VGRIAIFQEEAPTSQKPSSLFFSFLSSHLSEAERICAVLAERSVRQIAEHVDATGLLKIKAVTLALLPTTVWI
jgi:hypothetical protein